MSNYAISSIETHLFFARIMREHTLFLMAGFPCKEESWIRQADFFRGQFEELLKDAVRISDGRVSDSVIRSGELVTEFTIPAERRTESLTGISIDSRISELELALRCGGDEGLANFRDKAFLNQVHELNRRSLRLLNGLINFKESILREVKNGNLFTANYPLLIQHILREARLYRDTVMECMRGRRFSMHHLCETEIFWNQIMMEHAWFIRGLLDPCEEELIDTADNFGDTFCALLKAAREQDAIASECNPKDRNAMNAVMGDCDALRKKSLEETIKYQQFKTAGTEGILKLKIDSIILPLLADHVLREANHYIRLLNCKL